MFSTRFRKSRVTQNTSSTIESKGPPVITARLPKNMVLASRDFSTFTAFLGASQAVAVTVSQTEPKSGSLPKAACARDGYGCRQGKGREGKG